MQAAGWASGVSLAQTELGERLAWAGRERLSPADRAMLAALAGPNYPAASSRLEYLAAEKRAVDEAPDRPEAWYELGDRYYHDGQMLEIKEAPELAAAAFRRSRELDPTFVPALEHGILVAALRGDTDEVREQGKRYLARHSEAPNADFYRWRIAVALADTVALSELRTRFDQMSVQSLWRIMGYAERDGDELTDVGRARSALESGTFTPGEQARSRVFLYNLLMNAGRPEEALSYLDVQGEQDHAVLRGQILAALYWGGDTTAAAEAVTRLSPLAFGPTLPEQSGQETQYRDLCVLGLWSTHRDQWGTTESAIARLNGTAQSAVSSAVGESGFCARVLETSLAVRRGSSTSASLLSELDSATKIWPVPWPLHYPLLIELVLLFEDVGDVENALKVVRRQQYSWVSLHYLSAFLQLEGRLAAEFGETDSARRAYEHYLALRTDPEPSQLTEIAEVRAALEQLREGSRTTR
jgi:tetratricopeptide (TPR) repeat protein